MDVITYTTARQNLAKTIDKVCADHSPVIITHKSSPSVVLMTLEHYEALEETAYLLRSPRNMRRLITTGSWRRSRKGYNGVNLIFSDHAWEDYL